MPARLNVATADPLKCSPIVALTQTARLVKHNSADTRARAWRPSCARTRCIASRSDDERGGQLVEKLCDVVEGFAHPRGLQLQLARTSRAPFSLG